VEHLDKKLSAASGVEALRDSWRVFQGIQTGADAFSARVARRLPESDRRELERLAVPDRAPILELPPGTESSEPWASFPDVLAHSPEPRAILYAAFDDEDYTNLVWLDGSVEPPEPVLRALEPWRGVLANRAEILRNPRRRWWETAWPRSRADMKSPKVCALYRTDRGRFALDEDGLWQPSIKATVIVGRDPTNAPVAYPCGVLNSELLDLWYAVRGKTPWHVRRNYEPKRMNEMPYRRPCGDPRAEDVANAVRAIAGNRRALLPYRATVENLSRIVKDRGVADPSTFGDTGWSTSCRTTRRSPFASTSAWTHKSTAKASGGPSGAARRNSVLSEVG